MAFVVPRICLSPWKLGYQFGREPYRCWPKTNRLPDISQQRLGFLRSCKEIQFMVYCNFEPCTCPLTEKEGEHFYTGEKESWEGYGKQRVHGTTFGWVLDRKEYESFLFFFSFALVSKPDLAHSPDGQQSQSTDTKLWGSKVVSQIFSPWFLSCHSKELKWQTRRAWEARFVEQAVSSTLLRHENRPNPAGWSRSILAFIFISFVPSPGAFIFISFVPSLDVTWGLIACALWKWSMSLRPNRGKQMCQAYFPSRSLQSVPLLLFFFFCSPSVCMWSPSHHVLWLQFWTFFFLLLTA